VISYITSPPAFVTHNPDKRTAKIRSDIEDVLVRYAAVVEVVVATEVVVVDGAAVVEVVGLFVDVEQPATNIAKSKTPTPNIFFTERFLSLEGSVGLRRGSLSRPRSASPTHRHDR
jgi:hypothetical protein